MKVKFFLSALLLSSLLLAALSFSKTTAYARPIPTSGGARNTSLIELNLSNSYIVLGLSAQDVLGRPTGTISDFAAAMENIAGTDVIIFPANYFHTSGSGRANQIIGGVFSNGDIIYLGYFDWGAGFSRDNRFSFFECIHSQTDIVTAFNTYPHLIQYGIRHYPIPYHNQSFLNRRTSRAFMGQRLDGTFVIGNVSGANMREVQDIAAYLNLFNATNIDGGGSTGLWRNGSYITRPARQLPSVVYITNNRINVNLNGGPFEMNAHAIMLGGIPMVPLSAGAEALGLDLIGSSVITADDQIIPFGAFSRIIGGHNLVPLQRLVEAIDGTFMWMPDIRTAFITIEITDLDEQDSQQYLQH